MTLRILGIETSCDETSAAVVEDGRTILSNVIASQADFHAQYGGVFPEMASRMHIEAIYPVITQALSEAKTTLDDIHAVAVTRGPGLPGSLIVGVKRLEQIEDAVAAADLRIPPEHRERLDSLCPPPWRQMDPVRGSGTGPK